METPVHAPALAREPEPPRPLARIVCGVDGSRSSYSAVQQAADLAGAHGELILLAVTDERGYGPHAEATLDLPHARDALARAASLAERCGTRATTVSAQADVAADALLDQAGDADLVVVASHGHSRLGGIMIGSTTSRLVHRAGVPILVTRPLPEGRSVLENVVVACGGSCGAAAVEFAARIAAGSAPKVTLFRVDGHVDPIARPELSIAKARLQGMLGDEAVEVVKPGPILPSILGFADGEKATLVIVGSRGLTRTRALFSVSERVAHDATSSALVVRAAAHEA